MVGTKDGDRTVSDAPAREAESVPDRRAGRRPGRGWRLRALVGTLAVAAGATASARLAWATLPAATDRGAAPADLLVGAAATALAAILAWLLLCVLLTLLARLPGATGRAADRWRTAVTPALLRRGAALVVGLSVPVAGASSAMAAPAPAAAVAAPAAQGLGDTAPPADDEHPLGFPVTDPAPGSTTEEGAAPPGPGWVPDRPAPRSRADVGLVTGAERFAGEETGEVVVRSGDTLWAIAARALGPDASELEISRAWPAWYEANREAVGDDPDLLRPGTRLAIPHGADEDPTTTPTTTSPSEDHR